MLTAGIRTSYRSAISARQQNKLVRSLSASVPRDSSSASVGAMLFEADAASFLENPELGGEVFGPTTLVVRHSRREELLEIARGREGHLTATIHGTE